MSQTSFVDLAREHPDLRGALKKVEGWLDEHKQVTEVDPRMLARQLKNVDSTELARSLLVLANAGVLVRVYKVLTPSGVYADGDFDDPTRVPERLRDRFSVPFETAEADIVPIFRRHR